MAEQTYTNREIEEIFVRNSDMLYRIAFAYVKNTADAEDALQQTFLQLICKGPVFRDKEHEKAWLIRVIMNLCKNTLRHWSRRNESLEKLSSCAVYDKSQELVWAIMELPAKYRTEILLYYYEGYDSREIGEMLGKPSSTVRNDLHEARKRLKSILGDDILAE